MVVSVLFFDKFIENVGKGNINLTTHTFKVILTNGYIFDGADENKADIGAVEIANGNGYLTGGGTLANPTFTFSVDRTKWDADDVTWTASGGSIGPATGAIIYDDTATNDKLVCYIEFGATETAGDGTDFKITFNASGVLTIIQ